MVQQAFLWAKRRVIKIGELIRLLVVSSDFKRIVSRIICREKNQDRANHQGRVYNITVLKEPLTEDADARELAANGGGGPVDQVMKMGNHSL